MIVPNNWALVCKLAVPCSNWIFSGSMLDGALAGSMPRRIVTFSHETAGTGPSGEGNRASEARFRLLRSREQTTRIRNNGDIKGYLCSMHE